MEEKDAAEEKQTKTDDQIMSGLDAKFYTQDFDIMKYLWTILPSTSQEMYLLAKEHERALEIINEKLSQKVIDSYQSFMNAMKKIQDLEKELQNATQKCREGRGELRTAKEQLAVGGLYITVLYRRRHLYKNIIDYLIKIRNIMRLRDEIPKTLQAKDFPKAISLCLEAKSLVNNYKAFSAVASMDKTFQEEYLNLKKALDTALYECCKSKFDPENYERILVAYNHIKKNSRVSEKIQKHFSSIIDSIGRDVILQYIAKSNPKLTKETLDSYKKERLRNLCSKVTEENFLPCLYKILEQMCELIYRHHAMIRWHETHEQKEQTHSFFTEIKNGLVNYTKTMWEEIQGTIGIILITSALSTFKIDIFLKVLDALNKFIEIGEEFSSSNALKLKLSIKQQNAAYFSNFHRARMEDLRTRLENETWEKCPLPKDFGIKDIKEITSFLESNTVPRVDSTKLRKISFFVHYETFGNPFSAENISKESSFEMTTVLDSKSEQREEKEANQTNENTVGNKFKVEDTTEEDDALKVEFIDEDGGRASKTKSPIAQVKTTEESAGPMVTSTLINNVIRNIGKYLQIMKILQDITLEIFDGMTQLFDYYLYTIYNFFTPPLETFVCGLFITPRLKANLLRIKSKMILTDQPAEQQASNNPNLSRSPSKKAETELRFPKARPIAPIELDNSAAFFALPQLAIAVESLVYLQDVLNFLRPHFEILIPKQNLNVVHNFFEQSVATVADLRTLCYEGFCDRLLPSEALIKAVENCKWDIKEIPQDHNPYVDSIMKDFGSFIQRYNVMLKRTANFPTEVRQIVYDHMFKHIMFMLVEGYSRVKKWTNEGRASMSLDMRVLQLGLERLANMKPLPHVSFVENYIKAWYVPDDLILQWLKDHPEYTKNQLLGLVNNGPWSKQTKTACVTWLQQERK